MFRSFLKVALRSLGRQKLLTFINVAGLSIGITCFSLFLLYAVNEFSFDRVHINAADIYRVYSWWNYPERSGSEPASATPLGPAMKQDLPEVEDYVRLQSGSERIVRVNNKVNYLRVSFADPQLFTVFTFPLIRGNASAALKEPNNIVLTREKAEQFFGQTNIVGKIIEVKFGDKYEPFIVSAVAENTPVNSSIRFDAVGSFNYVLNTEDGRASSKDWNMTIGIEVYVQLARGSSLMNDAAKLAAFRDRYFPVEKTELMKENLGNGKGVLTSGYGLQPLRDVHTNVRIDKWGAVDPKKVWMLICIAAGILIIACINFITLSIGRSANRAKEAGIRKVIGSGKSQLVIQFLSESFLLSFLSGAIGFSLAEILLPLFNRFTDRALSFSFKEYPELAILLTGLIMVVGLISGGYPALVFSGFNPIDVLKKRIYLPGSNIFTKSLVTFQFILSTGLIAATIIILQQLRFMQTKDLGFDKNNLVMIDAQNSDINTYQRFRQQLQSDADILGVTASIGLGAGEGQMGGGYKINGNVVGVIEYPVDSGYLRVMGMRLLAGRYFDSSITSDTVNSVIVNEAFVNSIGTTPQKALGLQFSSPKNNSQVKTIIGVTKDFNFEDLTRKVRAQLFSQPADFKPSRYFVRINPADHSGALLRIQSVWENLVPELPFKYSFVDDKMNQFYEAEYRLSKIVAWAGGISISLACLGLLGLVSLYSVNRTKEIGIRKVSGASPSDIVILLSKDTLKLVIIALLIAFPIVFYILNMWLQNYAYRINISLWVFIASAGIAVIIAFLTISFQAIKAAMINPVDTLRCE